MLRSAALPIILGASAALIVGCGPGKSHVTGAEKAQGKAVAEQVIAKCMPSGVTQQIELAHSLDTKAGRTALETKCGITPAHKQAFEEQALAAAEKGHLTSKAGRTQYFTYTLPAIIERNQ